MGTSQSHKLLKKPSWSKAKKAMTDVVKNPTSANIQRWATAFANAVSSDASGSNGHFGSAGAQIMGNFIDFLISSQQNPNSFLGKNLEEYKNLSRGELIDLLFNTISGHRDSNPDEMAAQIAILQVLDEITENSESISDIQKTFINAANNDFPSILIDFHAHYIMEYSGELFQDHIFSKGGDVDVIYNDILEYVKVDIATELSHGTEKINFMSPQGKAYVESLTTKILSIWAQR